MSYSIEELNGKKVAELRDIARELEHEALQGYSSMRKGDLAAALATALGINPGAAAAKASKPAKPTPARKAAGKSAPASHRSFGVRRVDTRGLDKPALKEKVRALRLERDHAREAKDLKKLRVLRRQLHHLKRAVRSAPSAD